MPSLYDVYSVILLLDSVIDIATSATSPWLSDIAVFSMTIYFFGLLLGFGSPAGAFLFDKSIISKGHFPNNLASRSNLPTYSLLAMTTSFVCGA